ncbi:hypothetical protein AAEX28_10465 [Lentisphaerota bacterium WC36G]|nr:hypothetical protein LJT99_13310 [Lentisphaerae bacterium WC36]
MNGCNIDKKEVENLNLLGVFFYVFGGIVALFSLLPIFHFFMGLLIVCLPNQEPAQVPIKAMGIMFIIFALIFITIGECIAVALIIAGRKLRQQKAYMYCFVMSAVVCIFTPLGTVLGVFSIIELNKERVRHIFECKQTGGG